MRGAASLRSRLKRMWPLYLFYLFPLLGFIVFHYVPMYGVTIAFKDYSIGRGILGSPWNDFAHFRTLFANPFFFRIFRNTLVISLYRIVFGFPAPIVLAILINEVGNAAFKKVAQSISYLPHFMSWVVLAGILTEIFSPTRGALAYLMKLTGLEPLNVFTNKLLFRPFLIVTEIWQQVGWGTVVYLAAISSIDPGLYESAAIDGAGRFRRAVHITIPSIAPVITVLFILRLGHILDAGFEQVFNLYNPIVYEVADIIDTYVYRVGLIQRQYDFSSAVGLFKNVISVVLVLTVNSVVKRINTYGIW